MAILFDVLESHHLLQGVAVALLLIFTSTFYHELVDSFPYKNIPLIGKSKWEITNTKAKQRFVTSAKDLFAEGFSQVRSAPTSFRFSGSDSHIQGRKAFQVVFSTRPTIVLHPTLVDEVKNHPLLDFNEANRKVCYCRWYVHTDV